VKWIDVQVSDWFYRDVLEADRIKLDPYTNEGLFTGIPYNDFVVGKERIVQSYLSTDNQAEFLLPGYVASPDNPVYVFIEGARATPALIEDGKFVLSNPISGGMHVTAYSTGVPKMGTDPANVLAYQRPSTNGLSTYPSYKLFEAATYIYDPMKGEKCVVLSKSLKRVKVDVRAGETEQGAAARVIKDSDDLFTIIKGTIYVPYSMNNLPAHVEYSYNDSAGMAQYKYEDAVPTASYVDYADRFFPSINLLRQEFFLLLYKMMNNLYKRYTDTGPGFSTHNERNVPDVVVSDWFYAPVISVLNEKYQDGCYVFPLYDDGTFAPSSGITRAETVMCLNRMIEWAAERFR
jgi:hypothetical protein